MSGGRQMLKERYNAGRREKVHEDVRRRQAAKAVTCLLYFYLKNLYNCIFTNQRTLCVALAARLAVLYCFI